MAFDAGSIETKLDLDRTPFNQGLDRAERDAKAFERKKFRARVDIDVDQDRVQKAFRDIGAKKPPKVKIDADVDGKQVDDQLEKIARNTEKTAARSGNRIGRALVNPIVIQLGLLPAAAAVAAAGVGAALALPVIGIAAWGIAATKSNTEVRSAFRSLKEQVVQDSREMGQALTPALVNVAAQAQTAWAGLKPRFQEMFQTAGPLIAEFSNGLIGMGVNAIPGIQLALERGMPAIKGWNSLLKDTGTGLSDLFDNASRHSEAAKTGFEQLGTTIRVLLGFVGNLIGLFTEAWASIGSEFNATLGQLLDLVIQFGSGALPAMSGGFKAVLTILNGIMAVLGPFANFFGGITGTVLGAVVAYKLLGKAMSGIGAGFNFIKDKSTAAIGAIKNTGTSVLQMGGYYTKAAGDVDKATAAKGKFATAAGKVTSVLGKVGNSLPIIGAAFALLSGVVEELSKTSADRADDAKASFDAARDRMDQMNNAVIDATDKAKTEMVLYNEALRKFGATSDEAKVRQESLAKATLAEKEAQRLAAEATKTHTERLLDFFTALTGGLSAQVAYNNSIKDLKTKQDELAEAVKKHGKGSMDAKFAADELSLAMANQVQAAGNLAVAQAGNVSEFEKQRIGAQAVALEAFKLIDIFGNQAPPALYKTVAGLSDQELAAIGASREFGKTGEAIITLNGKKIVIQSNMAQAATEALTLKGRMDAIPTGNHFFNYFIKTVVEGPGPGTANLPIPLKNARGTSYFPGGLTHIDEQGPELIQLPRGSRVFTNRATQQMMERMMVNVASAVSGPAGNLNMAGLASAVATGVALAFESVRIQFDSAGVARLVNMENLRNGRR